MLNGTRSPDFIENLHQKLPKGSQEEGDKQGKCREIKTGLTDVERMQAYHHEDNRKLLGVLQVQLENAK